MGKLKALRIPEETVETPGGSFTVRGVSFVDIAALVRHHGPALAALFKEITSGKDVTLNTASIVDLGKRALETSPEIVADLIALASGSPDVESREIARQLTFPVQLDALEKIAKLTFVTEGGLGKLVEAVTRVMQGTSGAMESLQAPLTNGSAASAPM